MARVETDLLPWITRVDGVWTGREYPTAEAARAAEPDATVCEDNYVTGDRGFATGPHVTTIEREQVEPAWKRPDDNRGAIGLDLRKPKPPTG